MREILKKLYLKHTNYFNFLIFTSLNTIVGCTVVFWWSFYGWSLKFVLYYLIDMNFVMPSRYPITAPLHFSVYFHHSWEYAGTVYVKDLNDPYIIIE
uniref:ORF96 n=1 Tax=Vischeria cf. polyphem TaxID=1132302 RepID=A0A5J6Y4T9_9STRA|nr:ORF96 [Eustigmatos cf. polyphem]